MTKIKHDDLIESNIFDEAIKGAQALRAEYQKLFTDLQKKITIQIDTNSASAPNTKAGQDIIKQTAKDVKDLEKIYTDYSQKLQVVTQLQGQLENVQKAYNNTSVETRKEILAQAAALKQKEEQEKLNIKVTSTQEGTLARLRAELARSKAELVNDLKVGTEAYQKQQKAVADLTAQVKKEEEAIGVHTRSVGQYGKVVEGIKGAILGVTAVVGAMYGAVEFGKKVIESTGTTQEAFAVEMNGMKEATEAFFRSIANGDWSNLLTNMQEAMKAGKEYQEVMNDLEHRRRSQTIEESQVMVKVDQDLEKSRQKDIYSEEQRRGFIAEAIKLEKDLADKKVTNSQKEFDAVVNYSTFRTQLDKQTLLNYVKEYSNNENLIRQAEELNKKKAELALNQSSSAGVTSGGMSGMGAGGFASTTAKSNGTDPVTLQREISSASPIVSGFADIIKKYGNLNKAAMDKLVESWKGLGTAQQEVYTNTMRAEGRLSTLNVSIAAEKQKGIDAAAKAQAKADNKAEKNQIALEKSGADLRKEYDAGLKETLKAEDDKYKTLKSMGLLTQDEIIKHEMDSFTQSKEFALMTEKEKLDAITKMHEKAMQEAAKNGSGTAESGTVQVDNPSTPVDSAKIPDMTTALGDFQAWYKNNIQYIQEFAKDAQQILSMVSQGITNNEKKQLQETQQNYDSEYALLDKQLKNKTISQAAYNQKKTALSEKQKAEELKIQKEAAKKQKEIQIIQAIINTALGVTGSLAQGGIIGWIEAAITLAMGVAEIAIMEGASFAKGGSGVIDKKKGGILKGKRHAQGGIPLPGIGTAEDGEYFGILNRGATSKYGNETLGLIFDSLNQKKFENVFQAPKPMTVNVTDKYQKLMYGELKNLNKDSTTVIDGDKKIIKQGNHTLITSRN